MSKQEVSEAEKVKELETEARTSCAKQASIASGRALPSTGSLRRLSQPFFKTEQESELIYKREMRGCMETRGFEYRE